MPCVCRVVLPLTSTRRALGCSALDLCFPIVGLPGPWHVLAAHRDVWPLDCAHLASGYAAPNACSS